MSTDSQWPSAPEQPNPYAAPAAAEPVAGPGYGRTPPSTQPGYAQPPYAQPPYAQPGYGQPSYGHPAPAGYPGAYPVAPYLSALASWGDRVAASLLDSLLSNIPMLVGFIPFVLSIETHVDRYGNSLPLPSADGLLALGLGYLAGLGVSLWNRTFRQGRTGRSVGKSAMHLRLISEATAQPPGPGGAFLRELVHTLDGCAYVGYLWPLWNPKHQTFADIICKTVVVRD